MRHIRRISLVELLAIIVIIAIAGIIIYAQVDYIRKGEDTTYEIKLEKCMEIYHDYDYCKYRSY